jgi:hypothetical protein
MYHGGSQNRPVFQRRKCVSECVNKLLYRCSVYVCMYVGTGLDISIWHCVDNGYIIHLNAKASVATLHPLSVI